MSTEPYTPSLGQMREWHVRADHTGNKSRAEYEAEFDRFIARIKEDARADALFRGAEIGWDAAVGAMRFEDGTKPDFVEVANPYRKKEN